MLWVRLCTGAFALAFSRPMPQTLWWRGSRDHRNRERFTADDLVHCVVDVKEQWR